MLRVTKAKVADLTTALPLVAALGCWDSAAAPAKSFGFLGVVQSTEVKGGHDRAERMPRNYGSADVQFGPVVSDVVDAKLRSDSLILVLDRYGTIRAYDANFGIKRILSVAQAYDTLVTGALSLVLGDENVATWEPAEHLLRWVTPSGQRIRIERLYEEDATQQRGVIRLTGQVRPFDPYGLHGRATRHGEVTYFEQWPALDHPVGGPIEAYVLAVSDARTDTLWTGISTVPAVKRDSIWICCGRAPLFSAQAWWGIRTDGGAVVGSGNSPRLTWLDRSGTPIHAIEWSYVAKQISQDDALKYWKVAYDEVLPDSADSFRRQRVRGLQRRFDDFAGFVSHIEPAFTQLLVDAADRVWLRRFDVTMWPDGLSSAWDVFSSDGSYCGTIQIPGVHYVFSVGSHTMIGSKRRAKNSHELVRATFTVCAESER
jgi:hypothetical protein